MNRFLKYRRFIMAIIGTLPLIVSLGSSQAALAATARSDISVTLTANRSQLKMGQKITYTAIMTNHGPDDAFFVDVGVFLPDQLSLVSMTCGQGVSPDTPFCEYSTLAAGETVITRVVATPAPGAQIQNKNLKITAKIFFEVDCSFDPNCTFDPHLRNNSDAVTTKLLGK